MGNPGAGLPASGWPQPRCGEQSSPRSPRAGSLAVATVPWGVLAQPLCPPELMRAWRGQEGARGEPWGAQAVGGGACWQPRLSAGAFRGILLLCRRCLRQTHAGLAPQTAGGQIRAGARPGRHHAGVDAGVEPGWVRAEPCSTTERQGRGPALLLRGLFFIIIIIFSFPPSFQGQPQPLWLCFTASFPR